MTTTASLSPTGDNIADANSPSKNSANGKKRGNFFKRLFSASNASLRHSKSTINKQPSEKPSSGPQRQQEQPPVSHTDETNNFVSSQSPTLAEQEYDEKQAKQEENDAGDSTVVSTDTNAETSSVQASEGRDQTHADALSEKHKHDYKTTNNTSSKDEGTLSSIENPPAIETSPPSEEMPVTVNEEAGRKDSSAEAATPSTPFDTALELFEGKADFLDHDQVASWLGGSGPDRGDVRAYYLSLFDWTDKPVLAAMRSLCDKLYMKAESQQLDRIIDSFADRWCECNPQHGFKSPGVIYTLAYSILLLNTDHHSEDYHGAKKMSRSQYVQQTLSTMKNLLLAEDCNIEENNDLESVTSRRKESMDSSYARGSPHLGSSNNKKRWSITKMDNTALISDTTLHSPKEWESIIVSLLKSVYASIDMYPLNLAKNKNGTNLQPQTSYSSLNRQPGGRSFSTIALPEPRNSSSLLNRLSLNRRSSWMNSSDTWSDYNYQDAVMSNNNVGNDVRPSSVRGHYLSKRRSLYSESTNSAFGLENIGFAGALRNTMIREENKNIPENSSTDLAKSPILNDDISMVSDTASFMTSAQGSVVDVATKPIDQGVDQKLALHGAPWAKEGLLKFQAYLDNSNVGKKYKKRDWVEVFVVVQNGYLKMFRFDTKNSSSSGLGHRRSKYNLSSASSNGSSSSSRPTSPTNVGAGNWLDSATMTDNISLCHTMAQVNPENKDEPQLNSKRSSVIISSSNYNSMAKSDATQWSLTLPSQGILLFLAGTREIADEYVYACNYWASRVSKEPLVEAVSSVEYGWEKPIELLEKKREKDPNIDSLPVISSGSFDVLMIDRVRVQVKEWKPPVQSTAHCNLNESDQLASLKRYINKVQESLEKHSSLRSDMMKIFQPGHLVSTRAHSNWEKRSQYLLKESVKYDTYVSTLERAVKDRLKIETVEEEENFENNRKSSVGTAKENDENTGDNVNNDD